MPKDYIHLIDTQSALDSFCNTLKKCGEDDFVSVDTEFTRTKSFFPGLNLIQICIKQDVYLIDTMSDINTDEFFKLFSALKASVLLYSAREDLEIIASKLSEIRDNLKLPKKCIDIQLLLSFFNLSFSEGLQSALLNYLKIDLPKDQTRSDWEKRPLTDAQIEYAANDVLYLERLYLEIMKHNNDAKPRYEWFVKEMDEFKKECSFVPVAEETYKSVSGAGALNIKELNVLKELCTRRYIYAVERDEALNRVITTKALCHLARMRKVNEKTLVKANMKYGAIRAHGKMVVEWHSEAVKKPLDENIEKPYDFYACHRDYEKAFKRLRHILREKARISEISEQLICNKQLCNDYFYNHFLNKEPLLTKSWYKECVGEIDFDSLISE